MILKCGKSPPSSAPNALMKSLTRTRSYLLSMDRETVSGNIWRCWRCVRVLSWVLYSTLCICICGNILYMNIRVFEYVETLACIYVYIYMRVCMFMCVCVVPSVYQCALETFACISVYICVYVAFL